LLILNDIFFPEKNIALFQMSVEFVLAALNSALIVGIIALLIYLNSKVGDLENDVSDFSRYRQNNEIQLQNLINDINKNDEYILSKKLYD